MNARVAIHDIKCIIIKGESFNFYKIKASKYK